MEKKKSVHTDEGLQGNERIEEAILALQQEPTEELLAHTLTVLRKRMQEKGQFIVAVEPPVGDGTMSSRPSGQRMVDSGGWHLPVLMRNCGEVAALCLRLWQIWDSYSGRRFLWKISRE